MPARWTLYRIACALFGLLTVWPSAAQNTTAAPPQPTDKVQPSPQAAVRKGVTFDEFVDAAIQQERRLTNAMRNFKPVVETYIQEQKHDSDVQTSPRNDGYFLSRLDLTGDAPGNREFETPDHSRLDKEKKLLRGEQPFAAVGF